MPASPVVTAYEAALPADDRIRRKQMFGSPCAFVNRQMFFGTFEETLVARIGPDRVAVVSDEEGMQAFSPSPGKVWDDYVQMGPDVGAERLKALALESLEWAAALPKKAKRPR